MFAIFRLCLQASETPKNQDAPQNNFAAGQNSSQNSSSGASKRASPSSIPPQNSAPSPASESLNPPGSSGSEPSRKSPKSALPGCASNSVIADCICQGNFYASRSGKCYACAANFECDGGAPTCASQNVAALASGSLDEKIMATFTCDPNRGLLCQSTAYMVDGGALGLSCQACPNNVNCDGSFSATCGALNVNLFLAVFGATYACSALGAAGALSCLNSDTFMTKDYGCALCSTAGGFTCDKTSTLRCGTAAFDTIQRRVAGLPNVDEIECKTDKFACKPDGPRTFYLNGLQSAALCVACPEFATCDGTAFVNSTTPTLNYCSGSAVPPAAAACSVDDGKKHECGQFPSCFDRKLCKNNNVIATTNCLCAAGFFRSEDGNDQTCFKCPPGFVCDGSLVFNCGSTVFKNLIDGTSIWGGNASETDPAMLGAEASHFLCKNGVLSCQQATGVHRYINLDNPDSPVCRTCPIGRVCTDSPALGCAPNFDCIANLDPTYKSATQCKASAFRANRDFGPLISDPDPPSPPPSSPPNFLICEACANASEPLRAFAAECNGENITVCSVSGTEQLFPNVAGSACARPCATEKNGVDPAATPANPAGCYCAADHYMSEEATPKCYPCPGAAVCDGSKNVLCVFGGAFKRTGAATDTVCSCGDNMEYEDAIGSDRKCSCVGNFYKADVGTPVVKTCFACPLGFTCAIDPAPSFASKVTCAQYVDHSSPDKKPAEVPAASIPDFVCQNVGALSGARCRPFDNGTQRLLVNAGPVGAPSLACIDCPVGYVCNGTRFLRCEGGVYDQSAMVAAPNDPVLGGALPLLYQCVADKFECGLPGSTSDKFLQTAPSTTPPPAFPFVCVDCPKANLLPGPNVACNGSRLASCGAKASATNFPNLDETQLKTTYCKDKTAGAEKIECVDDSLASLTVLNNSQYVDLLERKCKPCPDGFTCAGTESVVCAGKPVTDFQAFTCAEPYLICKGGLADKVYLSNTSCLPCPPNFQCNATEVVLCNGSRVFDLIGVSCVLIKVDPHEVEIQCSKANAPNSILAFVDPLFVCTSCDAAGFRCNQTTGIICDAKSAANPTPTPIPVPNIVDFVCITTPPSTTPPISPEITFVKCTDSSKMFATDKILVENSKCLVCPTGFTCDGTETASCGTTSDKFEVTAASAAEMQCQGNKPLCENSRKYLKIEEAAGKKTYKCVDCPSSWACNGTEFLQCDPLHVINGKDQENFTCSTILSCNIARTTPDSLVYSNMSTEPGDARSCSICHKNFTCQPIGPIKCGIYEITEPKKFLCLLQTPLESVLGCSDQSQTCVPTDPDNTGSCVLDKTKYLDTLDPIPSCKPCPNNFVCSGLAPVTCGALVLTDIRNGPNDLKCEAGAIRCKVSSLLFVAENQTCQACPENFTCSGGQFGVCGADGESVSNFEALECRLTPLGFAVFCRDITPKAAEDQWFVQNGAAAPGPPPPAGSRCARCPTAPPDKGFACDASRRVFCGAVLMDQAAISAFDCAEDSASTSAPKPRFLKCKDPNLFLNDSRLNIAAQIYDVACEPCPPGFSCAGTSVISCGKDSALYVELPGSALFKDGVRVFDCINNQLICVVDQLSNYLVLTEVLPSTTPKIYSGKCTACPTFFRCDGSYLVRCGTKNINSDTSLALRPDFVCTVNSTLKCADQSKLLTYTASNAPQCTSCGSFRCDGTSQIFCGSLQVPLNFSNTVETTYWLPTSIACDRLTSTLKCTPAEPKTYLAGLACLPCPSRARCAEAEIDCCPTSALSCGYSCDYSASIYCTNVIDAASSPVPAVDVAFYSCIDHELRCPMDGNYYGVKSGTPPAETLTCNACPAGWRCDGGASVSCDFDAAHLNVKLVDFLRFTCANKQGLICSSPTENYLRFRRDNEPATDPEATCVSCPFGFACDGKLSVSCGGKLVKSDDPGFDEHFATFVCVENTLFCKNSVKYLNSSNNQLLCVECVNQFICNGSGVAVCGSQPPMSDIISFKCNQVTGTLKCIEETKYIDNGVCNPCFPGFSCSGSEQIFCGPQLMDKQDIDVFLCVDGVLKCKDAGQYISGLVCVSCPFAFECDGTANKSNVMTLRLGLIIGALVMILVLAIVLTVVLYCKRKGRKDLAVRSDQAIKEVQQWETAKENVRILQKTGKFDVLSTEKLEPLEVIPEVQSSKGLGASLDVINAAPIVMKPEEVAPTPKLPTKGMIIDENGSEVLVF